MLKTKWKCNICEKLLASKQTAMKHMVLVHKTDGTCVNVVKVHVQETDNEKKGAKEMPKGPAVKNKAFSFFAPLANIFNDESRVESFSWGDKTDKTKKSDQNDNSVANSSGVGGLDMNISEAIVDAADNEQDTIEDVLSHYKSKTARPRFVPPTLPVCYPDPPRSILDQTINDLSPGPAGIQFLEIEPTLTSTVDDHSYSSPPDQLAEVSPHSKSDSVSNSGPSSYPTQDQGTLWERGLCRV